MQAKLIDKQATSAKFEVIVPASEVERTYHEVLGVIARQVRVPGFRPGKAPRGVLVKRIGEDALAQEVRDALLEANYPKAVRELELTPLDAHFHAEEPSEGSDYAFEVHVDLYPDFALADLGEIIIDTVPQEVSDEMVAASVAELQLEHATLVPVERAAQGGDYLLVESLRDGEASGNVLPIDLERVSPRLAEQLLGKRMGDEVELRLSPKLEDEDDEADEADGVADEAPAAELPTLKVLVKDIKEKEKPQADDEFAKTLGFETWDEVLGQVRENLERQLQADAFEAQREEFVDKLVSETAVELPVSLVNRRKASLLSNLAHDLQRRNLTLEGYLASLEEKGARAEFDADLQTSAENAVRRDLVLEKLLEVRGAGVSEQEFADAVRYMAAREGQDPAKFRREMGEEWLENYRFLLKRDKAVREAVRELVGGEEPAPDASDSPDAQPDASESADAQDEEAQDEDTNA